MGVNDVVFVVDDVKYFCPATKLGAKKVSDEKWDFGVEDEAK